MAKKKIKESKEERYHEDSIAMATIAMESALTRLKDGNSGWAISEVRSALKFLEAAREVSCD